MIRRVPLASVVQLRRAPMPARVVPLRRRHPITHSGVRPAAATDWEALRRLLWARCGAWCEACGQRLNPLLWDAHHRLPRSHGGRDDAATLVASLHRLRSAT